MFFMVEKNIYFFYLKNIFLVCVGVSACTVISHRVAQSLFRVCGLQLDHKMKHFKFKVMYTGQVSDINKL